MNLTRVSMHETSTRNRQNETKAMEKSIYLALPLFIVTFKWRLVYIAGKFYTLSRYIFSAGHSIKRDTLYVLFLSIFTVKAPRIYF